MWLDSSSFPFQLTNGAQVKAESHRLLKNIAKGQIEEWKLKEAPKIINYAIHEKFKQNPELKAQLAATGSAILAQSFAKWELSLFRGTSF